MDNYTIVNHNCRKPEESRKIDQIDGAPSGINKDYLDADLKIPTGLIEPPFLCRLLWWRKIDPWWYLKPRNDEAYAFLQDDRPFQSTNCLFDGNPLREHGIRVAKCSARTSY